METEISRLTKAMESDIQLVIEANNAVEKNKEIIFSIRYLQLVLTDKARHTYKKSSRPPKMSPHMSSQTDLGGRPPKFGRINENKHEQSCINLHLFFNCCCLCLAVVFVGLHIAQDSFKVFALSLHSGCCCCHYRWFWSVSIHIKNFKLVA